MEASTSRPLWGNAARSLSGRILRCPQWWTTAAEQPLLASSLYPERTSPFIVRNADEYGPAKASFTNVSFKYSIEDVPATAQRSDIPARDVSVSPAVAVQDVIGDLPPSYQEHEAMCSLLFLPLHSTPEESRPSARSVQNSDFRTQNVYWRSASLAMRSERPPSLHLHTGPEASTARAFSDLQHRAIPEQCHGVSPLPCAHR